jgi:hypothetical protein
MSSAEERRAARRANWTGGVARSFAEMDRIDLDAWQAMESVDRLHIAGFDRWPDHPDSRLDDLIANKLAAGRPQDLADAKLLERIRAGRERR